MTEEFNKWWDEDDLTTQGNNFTEGTPAYWAWEGWQAARAATVQEPLEYWNAVEGWVKIDEVREHFYSVGCGTIYKTAGEDRVPVYTTPPAQPEQERNFCPRCGKRTADLTVIHTCTPPQEKNT